MPSTNRRQVVRALGVAVGVGLAGCSGRRTSDEESSDQPGDTAGTAQPLTLPSVVARGDFPDGRVRLIKPGQVSFLNVFTTWCKPCQREMSEFRKLRATFDPDELHLVSITPEVNRGLVREFWREYDATWPVVSDASLRATQRWDATGYPTNLLFDPDGEPAGSNGPRIQGRRFAEFRDAVEAAGAEG